MHRFPECAHEKIILRQKIVIYLLLVLSTVVFACLSLNYFSDDLDNRTIPQIRRAIVQVSRLLPQLEENEQAVREVYGNLEKSRKLVYRNNEDSLKEHEHYGVRAEAIIDKTLSWMNRVAKLRVGREGHVIVVSQDDYSILAHQDEQFVGEKFFSIDNMDMSAIPDISEIGDKDSTEEFHLFFPSAFFKRNTNVEHFYEAIDAGIYGSVFAYKDTYILCGTTIREAIKYIFFRTFFTTLFFFLIAWVFVCYIGFAMPRQKDGKEFRTRLTYYSVLAVIIIFALTWYYETMMDVTDDIATMNDHARVAVETLNTYREYSNEISEWLDQQYLEQCRLALDLVKGRGKENLTRQELAEFAKELCVRYIYVFDKNGKVIVTNSPYDHFELSNNEKDQSYAFRPLLDGREYVIQEPQIDDSGAEKMQYITDITGTVRDRSQGSG